MVVGIVVTAGANIVRRVIVPDSDDAELDTYRSRLHPLERMLVVPKEEYESKPHEQIVREHTGRDPGDARYAVVNPDGAVVDVILIDPALDDYRHPGAHPQQHFVKCDNSVHGPNGEHHEDDERGIRVRYHASWIHSDAHGFERVKRLHEQQPTQGE